MDCGVDGLRVLITGASGGIGRALARAFAAEGCDLVLHAHTRPEELHAFVEAEGLEGRAICVVADVRDPDAVAAAFAEGEARFGRIDVCVANAGRWPRPDEGLHEASVERIRDTVAVNLLGATWTARAFLNGLARHGPRADGRGASLCFVGSTAGRFGERGHADYSLAKAGLHGLVRSLKNEIVRLDPWGRVNMVEPGWTVTEMAREELDVPGNIARAVRTMPLRQLGRAVDVARAVLVLCSPVLSRHVTGESLLLAGGMEGRVVWDEVDEDAVRRRTQVTPRR